MNPTNPSNLSYEQINWNKRLEHLKNIKKEFKSNFSLIILQTMQISVCDEYFNLGKISTHLNNFNKSDLSLPVFIQPSMSTIY